MEHRTSKRFWQLYQTLPPEVRALADKNYQLLKTNPSYPSLHFKKVDPALRRWSARVGDQYRALSMEIPSGFLWVWIGTHREYEKMLK